jgi:hypothetical protein
VKFIDALALESCPNCRGTRERPLEFWSSPTNGVVCVHPFHVPALEERQLQLSNGEADKWLERVRRSFPIGEDAA